MALYTEQKYLSLCFSSLYKTSLEPKRLCVCRMEMGWSWSSRHSFSMTWRPRPHVRVSLLKTHLFGFFSLSRHLVFKNKNNKFPQTYRRYFEIISSTCNRVLQAVGRCQAITGKGFVTAVKMAQCNEVELPLNITAGYKVNKRKKMSPDASRPQCSRE